MSTAAISIDDEVTRFLTLGHPDRAEIRVDPYPFYDRLREQDPVHRSNQGPWIITRYDDVLGLLQDPNLSRDIARVWLGASGSDSSAALRPAQRLIVSGMLWRDPPDHTRLRRLVQQSFSVAAIARAQERIEKHARRLLAALRARESFDFLHDYALELPGTVICELIGMPLDRMDDYEKWGMAAISVQEPSLPEDALARADDAAVECLAFYDDLVAEKRRHPGDDILSRLLAADAEESVHLTHDEIVGMCVLLHIAGHETTSNVMTNGLYHLTRHPDQYRLLRDDPSLAPAAVEEMLRYDGSGRNTMPRWASVDTTIAEHVIPAGDQVIGIFGAAHRDPAAFNDPNRFDITRTDNAHVAFGFGIHFCIGARLARAEAETTFRLLASEHPELVLAADDVVWRDSVVLRALETLPVAWS